MRDSTILFGKTNEFVLSHLSGSNLVNFSPEEFKHISQFITIQHQLINLNDIFDSFCFNVHQIYYHYKFPGDGSFTQRLIKDSSVESTHFSNYTQINSLISNILSSGILFTNKVQSLEKSYFPENSKIVSTVYDNNIEYRLFVILRNFSQHIGLPVEKNNNSYFFNIDTLINSNFNSEKKLKREFKQDLINAHIEGPLVYPAFSTLAVYIECAFEIFFKFISLLRKSILLSMDKEIRKIYYKYKSKLITYGPKPLINHIVFVNSLDQYPKKEYNVVNLNTSLSNYVLELKKQAQKFVRNNKNGNQWFE